ncbi:hypothetical protein [Parabacteroides faecis]|uniref:TerB family tellurite resistance protein n=1 Tax=Parabacteroides faecis TaxID=1217282 RepID=A0ABR6KK36_9BACT|nr:hypothetical protein [Parabacteroides faecis]MBB4621847.1 hypothetical protein [Parabacteroides faecis]GGJ83309.1 hypothetical protein GCM10007084_03830 [Parabacteroides faecis]
MGLLDLFRKKTSDNPVVDLYSDLTREQRYSIMQLYSLFNVTCFENLENSKISYGILMTASNDLGVTIQQANKYFETHGQFVNLMVQMRSINDKSILDILLLDYMKMIALSNEEKRVQRCELITNIYEELGYTEDDIIERIEKAAAMAGMFNL